MNRNTINTCYSLAMCVAVSCSALAETGDTVVSWPLPPGEEASARPFPCAMPSVIRVKDRLAGLYDAPGDNSVDHMHRDIGLAWLKLPLIPPSDPEGEQE